MKITGIKKIAAESKSLTGVYGPVHLHVLYDPSSGKAWASPLPANFRCDWDKRPEGVIGCGDLWNPTKMADIKEMIEGSAAAYAIYAKSREQEDRCIYEECLAYEAEQEARSKELCEYFEEQDRKYWSSINA